MHYLLFGLIRLF